MTVRSAEQIQGEIEAARNSLASSLDQLVARTSPKRLAVDGLDKAVAFAGSPKGKAIVAGVGVLVTLLIARKISRHRRG